MDQLKQLWAWIEANRDIWFDVMRVYLGLGLFVKGIQFINDQEFLLSVLQQSSKLEFKFRFVETFLAHYIPLAHLGGGLLLAAGLMTRISTLFQLPILAGAAFLATKEGLLTHAQQFEFTSLVLFLLVLILLHGAGRFSVDHYLRTH